MYMVMLVWCLLCLLHYRYASESPKIYIGNKLSYMLNKLIYQTHETPCPQMHAMQMPYMSSTQICNSSLLKFHFT